MKKILNAVKDFVLLEVAVTYVVVSTTIEGVKNIAKSFKKEEEN